MVRKACCEYRSHIRDPELRGIDVIHLFQCVQHRRRQGLAQLGDQCGRGLLTDALIDRRRSLMLLREVLPKQLCNEQSRGHQRHKRNEPQGTMPQERLIHHLKIAEVSHYASGFPSSTIVAKLTGIWRPSQDAVDK